MWVQIAKGRTIIQTFYPNYIFKTWVSLYQRQHTKIADVKESNYYHHQFHMCFRPEWRQRKTGVRGMGRKKKKHMNNHDAGEFTKHQIYEKVERKKNKWRNRKRASNEKWIFFRSLVLDETKMHGRLYNTHIVERKINLLTLLNYCLRRQQPPKKNSTASSAQKKRAHWEFFSFRFSAFTYTHTHTFVHKLYNTTGN